MATTLPRAGSLMLFCSPLFCSVFSAYSWRVCVRSAKLTVLFSHCGMVLHLAVYGRICGSTHFCQGCQTLCQKFFRHYRPARHRADLLESLVWGYTLLRGRAFATAAPCLPHFETNRIHRPGGSPAHCSSGKCSQDSRFFLLSSPSSSSSPR